MSSPGCCCGCRLAARWRSGENVKAVVVVVVAVVFVVVVVVVVVFRIGMDRNRHQLSLQFF